MSFEENHDTRWFICNDEYQRGPLSWEAIMIDLESNMISDQDLIWTSGMSDWQTIRSVKNTPKPTVIPTIKSIPDQKTHTIVETQPPKIKKTKRAFSKKQKMVIWASTAMTIATITTAVIALNPERRFLNQIAHELSPEDLISAKSSAKTLVAITNGNARNPEFYVLTNQKNETQIDIQLQGIPGTLLGSTHYQSTQTLTVHDRWAKSFVFSELQNKPLSRGVYTVTVNHHENHEEIAKRSYFIGGPRDAEFESDLKNYNEKLAQKSKIEQSELKQYITTFETQLADSNRNFHEFIQQHEAKDQALKNWADQNSSWKTFQVQITQVFKDLSAEEINRNFYHYQIYSAMKKLEEDIRFLNDQQSMLVNQDSFQKQELNKIFDLETKLQSKIIDLQNKIQTINSF